MSFLEQRLNDAVARGSTGGPRGKRVKAYTDSGHLVQDFKWPNRLHRFDLSMGIKTMEDFESVLAMFYVVMFTPYTGFRIRYWNDYKATQLNSTLVFVDGTDWQLCRRYVVGPASFSAPIKKPVNDGLQVYRTRSGVITLATATVDYTTGLASISGHAGGDTYTWAGQFDIPVTFVDDAIDSISLDGVAGNELAGLPSIPCEEILL